MSLQIMGTQLRNLIVSLMLLIGSVTAVCAQTILVQGKVLDSRGTPLPKVSVTVKLDNSTHTTTDKEGKFSLQVPEKSVLVFTLWGGAEMGDLVRGALIAIPRHQYESAYALGLSPRQTMRRVILPQTLRRLAPPAVNLITRMIKTTSLVVLIGVVEVLKVGQQIIDANRFNYPTASLWIYGLIFALFFLICWPISLLSRHMEKTWQN